jgi:GDP-L-fucose synthase
MASQTIAMDKTNLVYVAGHRGLVGSAIVRKLKEEGYSRVLTASRDSVDLTDKAAVDAFFGANRPEYVFVAAAKVGGILANNNYPADFIRDNLLIEMNLIEASHRYGVQKILMLGSSCIYPKHAPQPIREEYLLTGTLEPTNEPYAVAKIAGIVMAQAYRRQHGLHAICLMPTNLYGPGDNFDLKSSHVLPAMIRKFHDAKKSGAKSVTLWGTGTPRREFLHVDDMAGACVFLMNAYDSPEIVNVGTGEDISIRELAEIAAEIVGFPGELDFDSSMPDGTPRKLLDVSRLRAAGWNIQRDLRTGIAETYEWYVRNYDTADGGAEAAGATHGASIL